MDRNDNLVFVTSVLMLVWLGQCRHKCLKELWQSKRWKIEPAKKLRQLRARTLQDPVLSPEACEPL